jgi:hypothetical protein
VRREMMNRIIQATTTTLNATGNGQVSFSPDGLPWKVVSLSITTTPIGADCEARSYLNVIGDAGYIEGTFSGSGDTSDTVITLYVGETLYVEWNNGPVNARATARITAWSGDKTEIIGG